MDGAAFSCHLAHAFDFYRSGHQRSAGFGLNRDLATLLAAGTEAAAYFEGHVLLRTQDNFPAHIPPHLVGINNASVTERRAINSDLPALRNDLAKIDGCVIARRDFDP